MADKDTKSTEQGQNPPAKPDLPPDSANKAHAPGVVNGKAPDKTPPAPDR